MLAGHRLNAKKLLEGCQLAWPRVTDQMTKDFLHVVIERATGQRMTDGTS